MPIKGLTDRGGQFPQIGQLRKGGVKVDDNKPGPDLKHFRFTTEDAGARKDFNEVYGDKPDSIKIILPFRTTEENFEAWQEEWVAGGLKHRCDGETVVLWLTPAGDYSHIEKKCTGGCKPAGRLKVVIPELKRLAYVTVLTTSKNDIIELTQNLQAIEAIRGDLRYIPLLLNRVPRKISTPQQGGKRARREKWLLHVEVEQKWVALQLAAGQEAALPRANVEQLLLSPGPDDEDDEDIPDITGYVEEIEGEVVTEAPEPPKEKKTEKINGKIDSTSFWVAVRDAGLKQVDAKPIADRVQKGELSWAQAIGELPQ